jgi:hypothetical protein
MKGKSLRLTVLSLVTGITLLTPVFGVSAAAVYEKESNNTRGTATSLAMNVECLGHISEATDVDYYKVSITTPSKVDIKLSHPEMSPADTYGWDVTFYSFVNSTLTEVTSFNAAPELLKTFSNRLRVPAGTYYVKVEAEAPYSWGVADEQYGITVKVVDESAIRAEREVNNTRATATYINQNTTYVGNIQGETDVDYYRFKTTAPSAVSIRFDHGDMTGSYGWDVTIYRYADSQLTQLLQYTVQPETNTTYSSKLRVPAGSYYVLVEPEYSYSFVNSQYNIKAKVVDETTVRAERESNNTRATATSISKGITYRGNSQTNADLDYYKFTCTKTLSTRIAFRRPEITAGYWDITLYRYTSAGLTKLTYFMSSSYDGTLTYSKWQSLPAGTYYILVDPSYSIPSNDYNVKVCMK